MLGFEKKNTATQQSSPEQAKPAVVSPGQSFLSGFPGFLKIGLGVFKDDKNKLNVKAVNALLFALVVLLTLYYINGISVSLKKVNHINIADFMRNSPAAQATSQEISVLQPFSFYQEALKKRDIFKMGERVAVGGPELISSKAAQASESLKLVGISWSVQPDAMIEDSKAGKTYFVKKGAMVGDFRVEGIYKDKVVLQYGLESIELR